MSGAIGVVASTGAPGTVISAVTVPDEIARKLHLTAGTVRNHLTRILHKVGARNRVEAVRIANKEGWI